MTEAQAIQLIGGAVHGAGQSTGRWADLGAGTGAFTRALASLIGAGGRVLALERDEHAIPALEALSRESQSDARLAPIDVQHGDFTAPLSVSRLDGLLLANALHFVAYPDQARILEQLGLHLNADGRIIIVEYDRDRGNDWVPYPISRTAIASLAHSAGLSTPVDAGRMRSTFGGELYCVWTSRLASTPSLSSHQP